MRELIIDNKADAYCLVNGQTFRHFILNIEAYAEAAVDPAHFDAADFSLRWATRYCGEAAAPLVVRAFQILHHASSRGYVGLLHRIGKDLRILRRKEAREAPGKRHYIRDRVVSRLAKLQEALHLATKALALAGDKAGFCYDHVVLPITLFCQTMEFRLALQDALWARDRYEATGDPKECDRANGFIEDAKEIWKHHLETRAIGDTNPKWKTWYDPEKRRPNGGFPTLEELEEIHFVA